MGSILTNNSAMVALQSLSNINRDLGQVQSEISTGLKIGQAKDNAAIFAISQVMRSDVKGFEAISDSLSLGQSTVAVGSNAAKAVGERLNDIKQLIISSNGENVDRGKLQDEIESLRGQISGGVNAAQFNGLNVLSNKESTAGSSTFSVLSSLDRAPGATGVNTSSISVAKQDLGAEASAVGSGGAATVTAAGAGALADGDTDTITIGGTITAGDSVSFAAAAFGTSGDIDFVIRDGDTLADVATGLASRINFALASEGIEGFTVSASGADLTIVNNSGAATGDLSDGAVVVVESGGTIGGGLELLNDIDVTTTEGAAAGLSAIEDLIQISVKAQAALGTSENRIEVQNEFMSTLIDSFRSGIGTLVDSNLEEAAARLQALQVQQQLGTQALSIANQSPQSILTLFR
ncbi:flagellin [Pikeienuella piscinae]|uniref:Flagellin n=1 Tax=Pikeienuella piscinae TaxID=2748098 RepID=A0A7L5BZ18_9RHOB|nr:flagellin [Pikeienuella piscinae]QIE56982.1 flagellin [Pikeienuella piscinae]